MIQITISLFYADGHHVTYGADARRTQRISYDEKTQVHSDDVDMIILSLISNMNGDANDLYEWLIPYLHKEHIEKIQVSYLKDNKVKRHTFTADDLSDLAGMNTIVLYYYPKGIDDVKHLPVNAYGDKANAEIVIVNCDASIESAAKQILEDKYKNISHVSFIFNPEQAAASLAEKTTSYF